MMQHSLDSGVAAKHWRDASDVRIGLGLVGRGRGRGGAIEAAATFHPQMKRQEFTQHDA